MKHTMHTFTLDDEGRLLFWNGEELKRGDKKVPSGYVPSIYLMKCEDRIVYVGETMNGIVRCIKGLHNNPNESIAYKWRAKEFLRNKTLDCVIFQELHDTTKFNPARHREALEAEIAWLVKKETEEWPLCLSKINPSALMSRDAVHKKLVKIIHQQLYNLKWFSEKTSANTQHGR